MNKSLSKLDLGKKSSRLRFDGYYFLKRRFLLDFVEYYSAGDLVNKQKNIKL